MSYMNYGEIQWKICCGTSLEKIERKALSVLYGAVAGYVPYVLSVCHPGEETANDNLIYFGTAKSNPALTPLEKKGVYRPNREPEGYSINVAPSLRCAERTDIVIQGADPSGVLYGVYSFITAYLDDIWKYEGYHFNRRAELFRDPAPRFALSESPSVKNRGIWTWGHRIYDYRTFLENMARCKMNMLIMWNDFAPVNGKEIVEYAHDCGIRVIWGFSCGWGDDVEVDPLDDGNMEKWCRKVLDTYETEYLPLGGDGLYFQGFTERNETSINGVSIASLITRWINTVAGKLHRKFPELYIQFGLHATSIRENFGELGALSGDATPVWEDCGSFPYHYDPREGNIPETFEYHKKIIELAEKNGKFGAVFKGFTVLNWKTFEHYRGRTLIGESDELFRRERLEEKRFYWKFCEPYWINNAPILREFCRAVENAKLSESTVVALVEDGMFEDAVSPSVGLFAELIWNAKTDPQKLIERVYHSEHYRIG